MVKKIARRLINMRLCELIWIILICVNCFVFWMYFDWSNLQEIKISQYPVILWWTMEFPASKNVLDCSNNIKCYIYSNKELPKVSKVDAYMFYASNIDFNNLPRHSNGIVWALFHEESPRNVEELLHEKALNLFNFSSTFSRFSDIPFPLQYLNSFEDITSVKYFVKSSQKNQYLKTISPVMYLQSDCETSTERDKYVRELMKYIPIDSYGTCLKNKQWPKKFTQDYLNNLNDDEFLHFISRYKFVIAIENGVCNDYVTEKFWRAIKVGTVPIYFGSPTIRDWLPNNNSVILLEDYPTPKILSDHLKKLLKNDSLYETYLEHKLKQVITNNKLVNEYKSRPYQLDSMKTIQMFECYVCEKLYVKNEGEIANIVNKSHYDCPMPRTALSLKVDFASSWYYSWKNAELRASGIYNFVFNRN